MPSHDHCCVFGCTNRRVSHPYLSFHGFPSDPELRGKWIQACKREEGAHFTVTKNTVVCSSHFREKDFFSAIPGMTSTRRLRPGAVPSIFTFRPPVVERPSPSERRAVAAARQEEFASQTPVKKPKRGESEREFNLRCDLEAANSRILELEQNVKVLTDENRLLRSQIFRFENIQSESDRLSFLTGLNRQTWDSVWAFLQPSEENVLSTHASAAIEKGRKIAHGRGRKPSLSLEDQLLLTLMRLRLGHLEEELGYMFNVDAATISRIFAKWINFLYLRLGMIPIWPEWSDVEASMPEVFKTSYPDTFLIIDATELRCERPSSLSLQSQNYSAYKSHTTLKGLVGITPSGMFAFISQLYTGSISDRQLVMESGLLPLLDSVPPGKNIMADRGFEIQDLLVKPNLLLNMPPFKGSRTSMPVDDVVKTQKIASVRIHVERAIGRVKGCFRIFDREIPLTTIGLSNQIWAICCMLTNFFPPIIVQVDSKPDV